MLTRFQIKIQVYFSTDISMGYSSDCPIIASIRHSKYVPCICTDYTGVSCQLIEDSCSKAPCKNEGSCVTQSIGYSCTCMDGMDVTVIMSAIIYAAMCRVFVIS